LIDRGSAGGDALADAGVVAVDHHDRTERLQPAVEDVQQGAPGVEDAIDTGQIDDAGDGPR
jgi:hypothetical protein